jgi:hypothetical protein
LATDPTAQAIVEFLAAGLAEHVFGTPPDDKSIQHD